MAKYTCQMAIFLDVAKGFTFLGSISSRVTMRPLNAQGGMLLK